MSSTKKVPADNREFTLLNSPSSIPPSSTTTFVATSALGSKLNTSMLDVDAAFATFVFDCVCSYCNPACTGPVMFLLAPPL